METYILKSFDIDELLTEVIERTLLNMHQRKEITESQFENFGSVDDCIEIMLERMGIYIDSALDELEDQQIEVDNANKE